LVENAGDPGILRTGGAIANLKGQSRIQGYNPSNAPPLEERGRGLGVGKKETA